MNSNSCYSLFIYPQRTRMAPARYHWAASKECPSYDLCPRWCHCGCGGRILFESSHTVPALPVQTKECDIRHMSKKSTYTGTVHYHSKVWGLW